MKRNALFVSFFALLLLVAPAPGEEDIVNEILADPPATGLLVTQVVSGSRKNVRPGARIFTIVVM